MIRSIALIVVVVVTASSAEAAWRLCSGWPTAAAASHACCDSGATAAAVRASADDCCALSQPPADRGPIEGRFAPGPSPAMRVSVQAAFDVLGLEQFLMPRAAPPPSVPFYLRSSALLI